MGVFTSIGAAYLEGRQIKAALLFRFDWNDGNVAPKRFFMGEGKLTAGGEIWHGSGRLVSTSALQHSFKGEAPEAQFVVSGVDADLIALTVDTADAVRGRKVEAFYQYYDADEPGWVPLDDPILFWTNTMKTLTFKLQENERQIILGCEGPFFLRKRPLLSNLSDADQKARFPGDLGCEHMSHLVDVTLNWPVFS